jgi:hypothetical protein
MMKLWERNDAPPHVDGAPGAAADPYLVLCHRPPEDAAAATAAIATSVEPGASPLGDGYGFHGTESDERPGLDGTGGVTEHTAVVYQWVRIATELLAR